MKRRIITGFCVFCLCIAIGIQVNAASVMLNFETSQSNVKIGDKVTVTLTMQGTAAIASADFYIDYDSRMLEFESGGKYVSGSSGLLHVKAAKLSGDKTTRKFALTFLAIGAGGSNVSISDQPQIKDKEGASMSASSNRVSITIDSNGSKPAAESGEEGETGETGETVEPSPTPDPLLNRSPENALASLKLADGLLEPLFDEGVQEYKVTVDNSISVLYLSAIAKDEKANVRIKNNEELAEGKDTKVVVEVTAENEDKKEYNIQVYRESREETEKRLKEMEGEDNKGIDFKVYTENGKTFLQNSYQFQIVDLKDESEIPAGYIKTEVILYGTSITAYTIEKDLDNDYLLIYAMNEDGDKDFYQYDRVEKSLQRYTGNLVAKVNGSVRTSTARSASEYRSNMTQMAIIIAILAAICALLVLGIIKLVLRQKENSDELNL